MVRFFSVPSVHDACMNQNHFCNSIAKIFSVKASANKTAESESFVKSHTVGTLPARHLMNLWRAENKSNKAGETLQKRLQKPPTHTGNSTKQQKQHKRPKTLSWIGVPVAGVLPVAFGCFAFCSGKTPATKSLLQETKVRTRQEVPPKFLLPFVIQANGVHTNKSLVAETFAVENKLLLQDKRLEEVTQKTSHHNPLNDCA